MLALEVGLTYSNCGQDLHDYMRGVSTPAHVYAHVAESYIQSRAAKPAEKDENLSETVHALTNSTRAYTRVVLRLRAQAEADFKAHPASPPAQISSSSRSNIYTSTQTRTSNSRASSRAPSPSRSSFSHSHQSHSPAAANIGIAPSRPPAPSTGFRSPLFRLRRAPLLHVFVPSPDGDWLSDSSVLECEAELNRAGVTHMLRLGDVVWDVAVGDEGNVGRLVWDGSYLIVSLRNFSCLARVLIYSKTRILISLILP